MTWFVSYCNNIMWYCNPNRVKLSSLLSRCFWWFNAKPHLRVWNKEWEHCWHVGHQSLEQGQGHRQEEGPGTDLMIVYWYHTMILYIFILCKIQYYMKYKKRVKGQTSVSDMRSVVGWSSLKTFSIRVMIGALSGTRCSWRCSCLNAVKDKCRRGWWRRWS